MLLGGIDLIFGRGIVVGAGLHLDKNQRLPVAGDDVDLAHLAAEIADDDLVTQIPQMPGGHVFAAIPQRVAFLGALNKLWNQLDMI